MEQVIDDSIPINYKGTDKDHLAHIITYVDARPSSMACLGDYVSPTAEKILTSKFNAYFLRHKYAVKNCEEFELNRSIRLTINQKRYVITFLDSKFSDGSIAVLIKGAFGTALYTGDFTYYSEFSSVPAMIPLFQKTRPLTYLYLDATYYEQESKFTNLEENINNIVELIKSNPNKKVHIFAEKYVSDPIVCEIALKTNEKVYVHESRMQAMKLIGFGKLFTSDLEKSRIIVAKGYVKRKGMSNDLLIGIQRIPEYTTNFLTHSYHSSNNTYYFYFYCHSTHKECCKLISDLNPEHLIPIKPSLIDHSKIKFTSIPIKPAFLDHPTNNVISNPRSPIISSLPKNKSMLEREIDNDSMPYPLKQNPEQSLNEQSETSDDTNETRNMHPAKCAATKSKKVAKAMGRSNESKNATVERVRKKIAQSYLSNIKKHPKNNKSPTLNEISKKLEKIKKMLKQHRHRQTPKFVTVSKTPKLSKTHGTPSNINKSPDKTQKHWAEYRKKFLEQNSKSFPSLIDNGQKLNSVSTDANNRLQENNTDQGLIWDKKEARESKVIPSPPHTPDEPPLKRFRVRQPSEINDSVGNVGTEMRPTPEPKELPCESSIHQEKEEVEVSSIESNVSGSCQLQKIIHDPCKSLLKPITTSKCVKRVNKSKITGVAEVKKPVVPVKKSVVPVKKPAVQKKELVVPIQKKSPQIFPKIDFIPFTVPLPKNGCSAAFVTLAPGELESNRFKLGEPCVSGSSECSSSVQTLPLRNAERPRISSNDVKIVPKSPEFSKLSPSLLEYRRNIPGIIHLRNISQERVQDSSGSHFFKDLTRQNSEKLVKVKSVYRIGVEKSATHDDWPPFKKTPLNKETKGIGTKLKSSPGDEDLHAQGLRVPNTNLPAIQETITGDSTPMIEKVFSLSDSLAKGEITPNNDMTAVKKIDPHTDFAVGEEMNRLKGIQIAGKSDILEHVQFMTKKASYQGLTGTKEIASNISLPLIDEMAPDQDLSIKEEITTKEGFSTESAFVKDSHSFHTFSKPQSTTNNIKNKTFKLTKPVHIKLLTGGKTYILAKNSNLSKLGLAKNNLPMKSKHAFSKDSSSLNIPLKPLTKMHSKTCTFEKNNLLEISKRPVSGLDKYNAILKSKYCLINNDNLSNLSLVIPKINNKTNPLWANRPTYDGQLEKIIKEEYDKPQIDSLLSSDPKDCVPFIREPTSEMDGASSDSNVDLTEKDKKPQVDPNLEENKSEVELLSVGSGIYLEKAFLKVKPVLHNVGDESENKEPEFKIEEPEVEIPFLGFEVNITTETDNLDVEPAKDDVKVDYKSENDEPEEPSVESGIILTKDEARLDVKPVLHDVEEVYNEPKNVRNHDIVYRDHNYSIRMADTRSLEEETTELCIKSGCDIVYLSVPVESAGFIDRELVKLMSQEYSETTDMSPLLNKINDMLQKPDASKLPTAKYKRCFVNLDKDEISRHYFYSKSEECYLPKFNGFWSLDTQQKYNSTFYSAFLKYYWALKQKVRYH